MALFVFLAAAAGARVVTADFLASLHRTGARAIVAAELYLRQFPFLLALDVAGEILHGGLGGQARLLGGVGTRLVSVPAAFFLLFVRKRHHRIRARSHLKKIQVANRFIFDPVHHGGENLVGFLLIFDQRVLLAVGPVADALLELVHGQQVVFPLVVDHLQHDDALGLAHDVGAHQILFLLIPLLETLANKIGHLLAGHLRHFGGVDPGAELAEDVVAQVGQFPGVGVLVVRAAPVDKLVDNALHHIHHPLFLVDAFEQAAAHAVDSLALLVVDVVIFQQVFAGFEVLGLHGFLRLGDAPRDHLGLDGHVLFHAQAQHEVLHLLAAENAQQVVLQRKEEARTAGVALAAGASTELIVDAAGFVALGGHNVQAAKGRHLIVLMVGANLEAGISGVPLVAGHTVMLVVVGEVIEVLVGDEFRLVFRKPLGHFVLDGGVLGHELRIAPQQNIGAAAGHVGGDRNRGFAAGLRHDGGFPLVILGVQDLMPDAHLLENARQVFGLLDRDGAHQHRLAFGVVFFDLLSGVAEFLRLGAVDHVGVFEANHGAVGRNHHHVKFVDLLKFGGFGFRGTGHAGELLVHAEIILEGDGGQGLVLALDLDAFLGFDSLMESVGPASSGHQAAGELIDDDHLRAFVAVFDHVLAVALVGHVGFQGRFHVVLPFDGIQAVDIGQAQQLGRLIETLFGERHGFVLFIDGVIAGGVLFAGLLAFDHFAADQFGDDAVGLVILVGRLLAGAGNDERGAGFVDQDGIHFVDDAVIVRALRAILEAELHVVAQVIEAELVVGAVRDV